ncbi:MAG TPA: tripartite tricarboxylate transporter substrate binding protein [Alphaproteobacteria bacterium]
MIRAILTTLLALSGLAGPAAAQQDWPNRPLKIITGFPAGSGVDVVARLVSDSLSRTLGQTVIVDPRPGAGGNVGTDAVAKSTPDGYTLYFGTSGTHAINPALYRNLPFDAQKDFAPITPLCDVPNILILNKAVPAKDLREFLALARANPGKINYGSSGNGTSMHLAGEQFKAFTKVDLIHIPYRGSPQATADLLGGQIQAMFHQVPAVIEQVQAGAFTVIGVTTTQRVRALPDVPTLAEAGLPGFESSTWYGMFAPAGTPAPVVARLNRDIVGFLNADLGRRLVDLGTVPRGATPAAFAAEIAADQAKWAAIIQTANIKLD